LEKYLFSQRYSNYSILLILFQILNRISVKYLAIVFYLFLLLYLTFGDKKSAISYNFADFLFPLMVTICKQPNHNCRLLIYWGELIVLIVLIVSTLFIVLRKRQTGETDIEIT
jgi:hypothetical protein